MRSRISSGSSRVVSAVAPTKSQNITVICRRSLAAERTLKSDVGATEFVADGADRNGFASARPQPPQYDSPARLSNPQAAHRRASAAPHCLQNRRSSRFAVWHTVHAKPIDIPFLANHRKTLDLARRGNDRFEMGLGAMFSTIPHFHLSAVELAGQTSGVGESLRSEFTIQ